MSFLNSIFAGSSSSIVDGAKLVLIGGTIETARRAGQSAWSSFLSSFYLTAHFSEDDYPWDWIQYWLQKQPQWRATREFETTTRTSASGMGRSSSSVDPFGDEDYDPSDELQPGKMKMSVVFKPTMDSTIGILYRGHWLRVRRSHQQNGNECISISVVARNNTVLKQLILEAKKMYEADAEHRVNIYFADSHASWRWTDSRTKRPMSSIVLEKGVKEMLLEDARDFLRSEKWYATRGIPFRRGYLLHGVPGSGKTSLIHALAGELALDIYVVSLSASWINDNTLCSLMGRVPARCIVLLEDLDAAFTRSATRDDDNGTGTPGSTGNSKKDNGDDDRNGSSFRKRRDYVPDCNTLSLSGLLNSLDGVTAPEGRLLFATTNHLERLDPALTRPGRMDVWVEFKNASRWQAELLYNNFFTRLDDEPEMMQSLPTESQLAEMQKEFALLDVQERKEGTSASASELGSKEFVPKDGSMPSNTAGAEKMAAAVDFPEDTTPPPVLSRPLTVIDPAKIAKLAKEFSAYIPDGEHSVASLQGYLLRNKNRPEAATNDAAAWVAREREARERLKRERAEREAKAIIDREKRRTEAIETKRRADRDELRRQREEAARIRKEDEDFEAEEKKWAAEAEAKEKAVTVKAEADANVKKTGEEAAEATSPGATTPADSVVDGETPGDASVVLVHSVPIPADAAEVPAPATAPASASA